MLLDVATEIIAHQVGVPHVAGQQALHPIGSGVANLLRQLPAVLSLYRAEQSPQVLQCPPTWLGPPKPSRNKPVYLFNTLGPPAHLRHLIPVRCHHLTSPTPKSSSILPSAICNCSTKLDHNRLGQAVKVFVAFGEQAGFYADGVGAALVIDQRNTDGCAGVAVVADLVVRLMPLTRCH